MPTATPRILHFLKIRARLLVRSLADAGWGLLAVAGLLVAGMSLPFLLKIAHEPRPIWGVVLALPAVLLHFSRRDGRFLQQVGLPLCPTLAAEYFLVSAPGLLLLIFSKNFWGIAALLACVAALPFVPLANRKSDDRANNFRLDWLPAWAFEWRAGIRQAGIGFWVLWVGGLSISWWVGGLPLAGFLFAAMAMSFFENVESREILQQRFARRGTFWQATLRHVGLGCLFLLPHALLFLAFNFQFWYFVPAIFAFVGLTVAFAFALKYAGWHPGRQRVGQSVPSGMFVLLAVSAIGSPAALFWWVWKARQADSVLKKYFADR